MKVLIAVTCLLAVASAQHYGGGNNYNNGGNQRYNGPYHVPVIGPNGVPQEPPEVIAARRTHLAAFQGHNQQAQPQPQYNPGPQQYQGQNNYQQQAAPVQQRYNGPLARIGADGMPQYDAQVAAVRQAHQAEYAKVLARHGNLQAQSAHQWH